jgi:hypothetical protein
VLVVVPRSGAQRDGHPPRGLAALLIVAAVMAAGCGGGGSSDTGSHAQVDKAADQDVARQAQLQLADFPSGWAQADEQDDQERVKCVGTEQARNTTTARGQSPRFNKGDNTYAESVAYTYPDDGAAHEAFTALASRDTRVCIGESIAKRLKDATKSKGPGDTGEIEVGKLSTGRLAVDPLGDERDGGRVTLPLGTQGLDLDATVDFAIVRVGRAIALLEFIDVPTPFNNDLRADLTRKVVRRLPVRVP